MTIHNTNITPQEMAEMPEDKFWPTLDKVAAGEIEVVQVVNKETNIPIATAANGVLIQEEIDFGAPPVPATKDITQPTLPLSNTKYTEFVNKKKSNNLINVIGMGIWSKERFEEGKRTRAIVERNGIWCVTTEEKLIGVDEKGKNLKMPIKAVVPSDAWNKFNNKYKNK